MKSRLFRLFVLLVVASMMISPAATQVSAQSNIPTDKGQEELTVREDSPSVSVVREFDKGSKDIETYIIQLEAPPLASYRGSVAGLSATSPRVTGTEKLNTESTASAAYLNYLDRQQTDFTASVARTTGRPAEVKFKYQYALNGIAVELSAAEAAAVAKLPGVVRVERSKDLELTTDAGPGWIGADSIWDGDTPGNAMTKGEGVLVGIIDTGINSRHPSFAEVGPTDGYVHNNPYGDGIYLGVCDPTESSYDSSFHCNNKLIGAWSFVTEAKTPEDSNGHGSHTASTAAGNLVTDVLDVGDVSLDTTVSGVAPHANIIAYDVCVETCPTESSLAAIDQAIADGVDVINYSISGSGNPYIDSVEQAFLNAYEAGVFVSASGGNEGPGPSTVAHRSPWVMTVAAGSHNRVFANALINMSGGDTAAPADITGQSFSSGYGPAPIVYAGDYGNALCADTFTAGTFSGEIVICDRGSYALVDKVDAAAAAGAGGVIIANVAGGAENLYSIAYSIPTVHILVADADALKTWLASGSSHMGTIAGSWGVYADGYADIMADFSSRGPNDSLDILKPDIMAPGVDILAANMAVPGEDPAEYTLMSGTSMSSPHDAGAAALMVALHPDWTPAMIKSAMMTTAYVSSSIYKENGTTVADPFDIGAGRIDLYAAASAGIVLDETPANFTASDPELGGDPRTLNMASLYNSKCLQNCSFTRTLKSVWQANVTWTVTVEGVTPGLAITVTPSSFILGAGETQEITIEVDASALPVDEWVFDALLFEPSVGSVSSAHFPLAIQPTNGVLPDSVTIETHRNAGSQLVEGLESIAISDLTVETFGFTEATLDELTMPEDATPTEVYDDLTDPGIFLKTVTVPAGAKRLVAEITDTTAADVDLFVHLDNGDGVPTEAEQVCTSATSTAFEYCSLENPPAGTYIILVQNWEASADGAEDTIVLASAVVLGASAGNMDVTGPESVVAGAPYDVRVYWDIPVMEEGDRWYGAFNLGPDASNPGTIGTIPVDIIRYQDDVTKEVDLDVAREGDELAYTITVEPSFFAEDLTYTLTDTIPAGLTYVDGSAAATAGTVNVIGNELTWTGEAPGVVPALVEYSAYGFMPLAGFGVTPAPCSTQCDETVLTVTGVDFYYNGVHYTTLAMISNGFIVPGGLDPTGLDLWWNTDLPDAAEPNNVIAPYWVDLDLNGSDPADPGAGTWYVGGLVAGTTTFTVLEWNGAQEYDQPGSSYSFQIWIVDGTDTIWFSYGPMVVGTGWGTVGFENEDGTDGTSYYYDGAGTMPSAAADLLITEVIDDPVVITFNTTVDTDVAAGTITNSVLHEVDNPGSKVASASADVLIEAAPQAAFSVTATNVLMKQFVTFTNQTVATEPVTYEWDFGDGETSSDVNPVHSYDELGTYTVTLTATNALGEDTATIEITVGLAELYLPAVMKQP